MDWIELAQDRGRWRALVTAVMNIHGYLQEVGCRGMDRIELAQDRGRWRALVTAVMNLRVP
jgi:hypothetical protein